MKIEFKPSWHVRTAYSDFYEYMKKEGYIDTYHQLFTYAFLIGTKSIMEGGTLSSDLPKNGDLFMIQNVTPSNLEVITGIAAFLLKESINSEEIFKRVLDIADFGITLLKTSLELDKGNLLLDTVID